MSSATPLTMNRRGKPTERRPLKIAVFSPIYGVNGPVAGLRWWFLSRYLTELGADVTVFHQTRCPGTLARVVVSGGAMPREVFVPPSGAAFAKLGYWTLRLVDACLEKRGKLRTWGVFAAEQMHILGCSGRRSVKAFDHQYPTGSPPDVMIASCAGWGGVTPALALSRRGIPYVLEFRDPWRLYHEETWPYHLRRVHRAAHRALATMNVTPLLCERDAAEFGKESLYLPHGFPPEALEVRIMNGNGTGPQSRGPLRVAYFGAMLFPHFNFLDWYRGLAALPAGVVHFQYAGKDETRVRQLIRETGIEDRSTVCPRIDQWDVYSRQSASDVLLLFASNNPNEPELFGFKSIEIRAAARPVLIVGPKNERLRAFVATGTRVLWASSPAEVAAALTGLAEEKRRDGKVAAWSNDTVIRDQCWDRLAGQLLDELYRLLPPRP